MKLPVSLTRRRLRVLPVALMPFVATVSNVARADLPTLEDPSRGPGDGIMDTLQNYGFDIVLLVALLVISSMFIGVCYHAYTQYSEIHTGRKTWGEFGLTAAAGAILLVIGIWLLTTATEIL